MHPNQNLSRDEYVALCEEKCEAPITQSHTRLIAARVPYWRHVGDDVGGGGGPPGEASKDDGGEGRNSGDGRDSDRNDHSDRNDRKHGKKKAKGGRLEKNRRQNQALDASRLCISVIKSGTCSYGDKCKFSHDVGAFLESKPADLVGPCPWVFAIEVAGDGNDPDDAHARLSVCPFGVGCRYYGAHASNGSNGSHVEQNEGTVETMKRDTSYNKEKITRTPEDMRFWMDDGTVPASNIGLPVVIDLPRRVLRPMNELQRDVLVGLRKRTYDFSRTETTLSELNITNTLKYNRRGKESDKREREVNLGAVEEDGPKSPSTSARDRPTRAQFDARGKTYLAPLTTVGNLPFRRLCKRFGADITCGEMAMAQNLISGQPSEWALLKRHPDEDFFGVQICGAHPDVMTHASQLIQENCAVDFVDINCGCPIDCVIQKGAGSACLKKPYKLEMIVRGMTSVLACPVTIKMRRGFNEGEDLAHKLIPSLGAWGVSAAVLHGRTRQQRYSKPADWDYIRETARINDSSCQVIGNGDVYGWQDHVRALESGDVATTYVARGALIKPWIFTEIKEQRDWDISASERLDIVRQFVQNGLEHWGSDSIGVENTRRFLLEWLSFTHRYIPCGLLEVLPQRSNWRPSAFVGRSDLESLLASPDPADWIRISTWFLGPVPPGYSFLAKHQAKSHGGGGGSQKNGRELPQENG